MIGRLSMRGCSVLGAGHPIYPAGDLQLRKGFAGEACAMGRGLVCALVLLSLGVTCVKVKGELCRAWILSTGLTTKVFQCPEKLDQADAQFCCGTCGSPYCCASRKSRLDQVQCSAELKAKLNPDAKRNVSPQTVRDLMNVLWIGMGAVITLLLCNWMCTCGSNVAQGMRLNPEWQRRRFCPDQWLQQQQQQQQVEVVTTQRPLPRPPLVGPSAPPVEYRSPDPPPYSAEAHLDAWAVQFHSAREENSEDEVVILSSPPIPPRTNPFRTVEPTL